MKNPSAAARQPPHLYNFYGKKAPEKLQKETNVVTCLLQGFLLGFYTQNFFSGRNCSRACLH
jgi:hypothetical protein